MTCWHTLKDHTRHFYTHIFLSYDIKFCPRISAIGKYQTLIAGKEMRESETGIEYSTSVTLIDESEHLAGAYIFFLIIPHSFPCFPKSIFSKFPLFQEIHFFPSSHCSQKFSLSDPRFSLRLPYQIFLANSTYKLLLPLSGYLNQKLDAFFRLYTLKY